MTLVLILAACLFGTSFAFVQHSSGLGGWPGGLVLSRRDASADTASIYQLVRDTLDRARASITAADLIDAALTIQTAADAYIDANGEEVPAQEVQALIDDIASKFNGAVAISALFDTPLTYEAYILDAALCLLNDLVDKAEELEAAGSSPNPAIAGISMTAESIQAIVADTVGYVTYMAETETEKGQPDKRQSKFDAGVSHGPGGLGVNAGVSHDWGNGWSAGVTGSYSQKGGLGVNAGVSYESKNGLSAGLTGSYSQGGGASIGAGFSYSWRR